ncbi:MAG: cation diffusion facilitator family transporter, partial [Acetobacter cibinongensis]
RDSLDLSLDAVPRSVNYAQVEAYLRALPGVADLHDLHIWALSTTETALTVHLVNTAPDGKGTDAASVLHRATDGLRTEFGIQHPTIQIEDALYVSNCPLTDPHSV